jgi:hypothetical protein
MMTGIMLIGTDILPMLSYMLWEYSALCGTKLVKKLSFTDNERQ